MRRAAGKACAAQALQAKLDQAIAWHASGALLVAELLYAEVLDAQPANAQALQQLGILLGQKGDTQQGLLLIDRALRITPQNPTFHANRALLLKDLMRLDEALAAFDRAIELKADYALAHYNRSMLLLLRGDLRRGFEAYEWRWKSTRQARQLPQPLWLGQVPLDGQTLLLHAEQGLGDAIQFARYAKLAMLRGARVLLEVPPSLVGLLQTMGDGLSGALQVLPTGSALPAFDLHCPLLSLPLAFGTDASDIPAPRAYLKADPAKLAQWAARLGRKRRPRVGLAWSGSTQNPGDAWRSIALACHLPFLQPDIEYVSLHKDLRPADEASLRQHGGIRHFGAEQQDFTDAAALAELMDLVISVDTSLAHLSCALGRPTWILLTQCPDWRWQLGRSDSPWYPTARLFRQGRAGDWTPVLSEVQAATALLFAQERERPPSASTESPARHRPADG